MENSVFIYKEWIELLAPLMESDKDKWAIVFSCALGVAFNDPAFDGAWCFDDPDLQNYWELTDIKPIANGKRGWIKIVRR